MRASWLIQLGTDFLKAFATIVWSCIDYGRRDGVCRYMLEKLEGLGNIAWHRKGYCALFMVESDGDANVFGACPVLGDGILES